MFVVTLSLISDEIGNVMSNYSLILNPEKNPKPVGFCLIGAYYDMYGNAYAGSDAKLEIFFDAALNESQDLSNMIMLISESADAEFTANMSINFSSIIISMKNLPLGKNNTVIISSQILGENGYSLGMNYQFDFKTIAQPEVLLIRPTKTKDVLPNEKIELRFSHPINESELSQHLRLVSTVGDVVNGVITLSEGDTYATFVPSTLSYATGYILTLDNFESEWDTMFPRYTWSFTTTSLLTATLISPIFLNDVKPDSEFVIAFSKPVNKTSAEENVRISDNEGKYIECAYIWEGEQILNIKPNSLNFSSTYAIHIEGVKDEFGISVESHEFPLTFTTYKLGNASLISPRDGATNASVKVELVIKFDRQMNLTSVDEGLEILPYAEMSISSISGETIVVKFEKTLKYSCRYTITLEGAKDYLGYELKENYTWSFVTEDKPKEKSELPVWLIILFVSFVCILCGTTFYFWYQAKNRRSVYITESVFVMSKDGRIMAWKMKEGLSEGIDKDIFASMFTAVQSFIADSFGGEELGAIKHGDKTLTVVKGKECSMIVTTYGEPDDRLQKRASAALAEFENRHRADILNWSGVSDIFSRSLSLFDPIFALSSGITKDKVDEFMRKKPLSINCEVLMRSADRAYVRVNVQNTYGEVLEKCVLRCNLKMTSVIYGQGILVSNNEYQIGEIQKGTNSFEIELSLGLGKRATFQLIGKTKNGNEKSAEVSLIV
jgi:hypothetical protein